jgi:hypothetical protein
LECGEIYLALRRSRDWSRNNNDIDALPGKAPIRGKGEPRHLVPIFMIAPPRRGLFALCCILLAAPSFCIIPQAEFFALRDLYLSTGGPTWDPLVNWRQVTDPCLWDGVTCTSDNSTVVKLSLSGRNLNGSLTSLRPLSNLVHL